MALCFLLYLSTDNKIMDTLPPTLPPSNSPYAAGPSLVELLPGGRLARIHGRFCLILLLVICEEQNRSNLEREKRSQGWGSATQHFAWDLAWGPGFNPQHHRRRGKAVQSASVNFSRRYSPSFPLICLSVARCWESRMIPWLYAPDSSSISSPALL